MRRIAWFLVPLLTVGCATLRGPAETPAAAEPPRRAAAGEETEQVDELQRQAAMAAAEIRLLRQSLAALQVEVERLASELDRATPPPSLPGSSAVRFETSDLDPVTIQPSPATPSPESPPRQEPREAPSAIVPARPPVATPSAPVPADGQSLYDQGYTLYHQGRYVDAESSFQRFLQAHGGTELADNAQFWIGESRFARQDHRGALAAFQEVVDRYPDGNKVGDALLKAGDCLARLGDVSAAMERYREVLERFPGSAASVMAEERLSRPGG
jgi:tol-pal system protein YbgF